MDYRYSSCLFFPLSIFLLLLSRSPFPTWRDLKSRPASSKLGSVLDLCQVPSLLIENATSALPKIHSRTCAVADGGFWEYDDAYNNTSTFEVDRRQKCKADRNTAYLRWKWRPEGRRVARRLNFSQIVENYGPRILFVGESLQRNLFEGFVDLIVASTPNLQLNFSEWIPAVPLAGGYNFDNIPGWFPNNGLEKALSLQLDGLFLHVAYVRANSPLVFGWNGTMFLTDNVAA